MDVRLWCKETITDFISLYKSSPCLWDTKSKVYRNRKLRDTALKNMVEFCQSRGFSDANQDFVLKKIQSLRGSFRKEFKKCLDNQQTGGGSEVYTPSLWYFDLLLFTKDQEVPAATVSNVDITVVKKEESQLETEEEDGWDEETRQEVTVPPVLQVLPPVQYKKRKAHDSHTGLLKLSTSALQGNSRPIDDFEAVGINLANKLAKMEPSQAIYAESLVSNIIRRGLLNKLTEETDFCENGCVNRQKD